jgi:hypothetical protein
VRNPSFPTGPYGGGERVARALLPLSKEGETALALA